MKMLTAVALAWLACLPAHSEPPAFNATHEWLQQKWKTVRFRWELNQGDAYTKGTSIVLERKDATRVIVSTFDVGPVTKETTVLSTISTEQAAAIVSSLTTFIDRAQKTPKNTAPNNASQSGFGTAEGFVSVEIATESGLTSDLLEGFGEDFDAFNSLCGFVKGLIENRGVPKPRP